MTPMPSSPLISGDVVAGRYRIDQLIGQGGFGAVFKATQLALGRQVALKMLLPDLVVQDEGLQRFRREAQLAQRLEHPNTVRLYDFGEADGGVPFIAFELLKGEGLDSALYSRGAMSAGKVARVATQVLKALMEAHALGIVHRDIKPPNIFLCDFQGEPDFVKVLDFGIAKATASTTAAGLTQAGHVVGTPQYMAPEQLLGNNASPPGDLYALGLVMAEALTGRMVFQGSATDVCMMQISPDSVPLPASVLQSPLGPVIHRATQKPIERRYANAAEMLQDIEGVIRQYGGDLDRRVPSAPPRPASTPPTMSSAVTQHPAQQAVRTEVSGHAAQTAPLIGGPPVPQVSIAPVVPLAPAVLPAPRAGGGGGGSSSAIIVVLLLVIAAMGGAGAYLFLGRSSGGDQSGESSGKKGKTIDDDDPDPDGKKKPPKKKPDPSDDDVDSPDVSSIRKGIEDAGYKVISDTVSHSNGVVVKVFSVQKGTDYGGVYVYKYDDPKLAKASLGAMKANTKAAVTLRGNTLIMVMIPPDAAASQDLLDKLVP
jgi:serine/threonine-protein kinase